MIEDVYRVMDRINEIKGRFGLNKSVPVTAETKKNQSADFESHLENAVGSYPPSTKFADKSVDYRQNLSKEMIDKIAERIALKEGVSPTLVKSVIKTESDYDADAVSPKGAMGLMQLMPKTTEEFGVTDPFSPEQNISGGVKMLKKLLGSYQGDYKKAIAAYNAGKTAVDNNGGVAPYKETREYVKKIIDTIGESEKE